MKRTLVCLVLLGLAAAPSAWADPPAWAPAHGWRAKHHYTYYPSAQAYYAPDTHAWFWLDGGTWRTGLRLPLDLHASIRTGGVSIELDTARPYVEHEYVVEHYGGGHARPAHHERDGHGTHGRHGRGHGRGDD